MIAIEDEITLGTIDQKTKKLVTKTESFSKIGTGFVVKNMSDRSVVFTANHVVELPDVSELPEEVKFLGL